MDEKELVDVMILEQMDKCFKHFGIEGTEEAINNNLNGKVKEEFLRIYHDLLWRK